MNELKFTEYFKTDFAANVEYVLINPFGKTINGINTYSHASKTLLDSYGIKNTTIKNSQGLKIHEFRDYCTEIIEKKFNPKNTIVECPETTSPCLNVSNEFFIHVRMHTPLAICQLFDNTEIDINRFSDEIRQIKKSSITSTPSYGLANIMMNYIPNFRFSKFVNPIITPYQTQIPTKKEYDVILMFRAQNLKGLEFIPKIVEILSTKGYRVLLVGKGMTQVSISSNGNIVAYEHINSDARYQLLSSSKCSLVLSKFENCSMAILESISLGTPVVAWNVGGNTEFNHQAVSTVPLGDIEGLIKMIENVLIKPQFNANELIKLINDEYMEGMVNIYEKFKSTSKSIQ